MDSTETADTELEARLRTHYEGVYGGPRSSAEVWGAISGRLGAQEGRESIEFARSVDTLYSPGDSPPLPAPVPAVERRMRPNTEQRTLFLRPTWRPALAAGLVLALVATLVVVMTLANQSGDRTIPAATPGDVLEYIDLKNPGFEEGFDGWLTDKYPYQNYAGGADFEVAHSGKASGYLKPVGVQQDARFTGSIGANLDAKQLHGKRVRYSAYLKSENVETWAGLWMRVDGARVSTDTASPVLSMDNMIERPVIGTTDWTRYEIVLDVPEEASQIVYGALLLGNGQIWLDDVTLEVVTSSVPVTDNYNGSSKQLVNSDFEQGLRGWAKYSLAYNSYNVASDSEIGHRGGASGRLEAAVDTPDKPGELGQRINAEIYRGQRVRFSAFVRTVAVTQGAGLEMAVIGRNGTATSYDDMTNRLIMGTREWQQYHVVLDVPSDARAIMVAVRLDGSGEVWIDDAALEIVGTDVPTTGTVR